MKKKDKEIKELLNVGWWLASYSFRWYLCASGGVRVKQARLANFHKWVGVSLGAPFIWPCATS